MYFVIVVPEWMILSLSKNRMNDINNTVGKEQQKQCDNTDNT